MTAALTEASLRQDVWPRFSESLSRPGVYLANHSLGRPLDAVREHVEEFLRLWFVDMDQAWTAWQAEQGRMSSNVERLIGAATGTITLRASAGQGVRAVLNSFPAGKPIRIVTTTGEFDSIDFILRTYESAGKCCLTWVEPTGKNQTFDASAILDSAIAGTDLVIVSHVFFGSGQILLGLRELGEALRERGILLLVDLYHAAGAIPVDVREFGADFAVGGSYKYLRGGPGASWLYVSPEMLKAGRFTTETGWFAKDDTFGYRRGAEIARKPGIGGWAESTPAVVAAYQSRAGIEFTLELTVERLRIYSLERQAMLREMLRRQGVPVLEPAEPAGYGAFSAIWSDRAADVCAAAAQLGVTVDSRGSLIRLCPDILNSEDELQLAAEVFAKCLP